MGENFERGPQPLPPSEGLPQPPKDPSKKDWSNVERILSEKEEAERAKMTPEEIAEDDERNKEVEEVHQLRERNDKITAGDPQAIAQKKQEQAASDERMSKRQQEFKRKSAEDRKRIFLYEYEEAKRRDEEFRAKYGIVKSEEELQQEDAELRRKFGVDPLLPRQ
jgi:hypothetical protein